MPQAAPAIIMGVTAVASAGMQIHGQRQQAKAVKASSEFNAKVAENEAIRVEQERAEQTARTRIANRRLLGKQRAAVAKAGVTTAGSPLQLMAETAGELELGVLDANRTASAKQTQLRSQASLIRFSGASKVAGLKNKQFATGILGAGKAGAYGAMGYNAMQK